MLVIRLLRQQTMAKWSPIRFDYQKYMTICIPVSDLFRVHVRGAAKQLIEIYLYYNRVELLILFTRPTHNGRKRVGHEFHNEIDAHLGLGTVRFFRVVIKKPTAIAVVQFPHDGNFTIFESREAKHR